MTFKGAAYTVIIDQNENVRVVDPYGNSAHLSECIWLARLLDDKYGDKTYIYIAKGAAPGLYKIGVTNDLQRRQRELKVEFAHVISCRRDTAFRYEALMHQRFERWRVNGEWFQLIPDSDGFDPIEKLKEFRTDGDLQRWLDPVSIPPSK